MSRLRSMANALTPVAARQGGSPLVSGRGGACGQLSCSFSYNFHWPGAFFLFSLPTIKIDLSTNVHSIRGHPESLTRLTRSRHHRIGPLFTPCPARHKRTEQISLEVSSDSYRTSLAVAISPKISSTCLRRSPQHAIRLALICSLPFFRSN